MTTVQELIGVHNGLNPAAPLNSWKKGKAILEDRIEKLRTEQAEPEAEVTEEVTTTEPVVDEPTKKPVKDGRTIRLAAMELLCFVDYHEDRLKSTGPDNMVEEDDSNARSVGIPYDQIIRHIKEEFTGCQTTVACLRWYSVKIRVEEAGYEGWRLPQRRPRAKPQRG